jgi:hypothetical protein
MGYGHNRAIHPLKVLNQDKLIIQSNEAPGISGFEKGLWKIVLNSYEYLSRASKIPLLGRLATKILDWMLFIPDKSNISELSHPTFPVRYLLVAVKLGLCKAITEITEQRQIPVITSFYAPAIASEVLTTQSVFCIICDTDLNRIWVSDKPSKSRITYFASLPRVVERLKTYGVQEKNIVFTGFPLPLELTGEKNSTILKLRLEKRLRNLDPSLNFHSIIKPDLLNHLNEDDCCEQVETYPDKITITYAVGGAGAQKETGRMIAKSLFRLIETGRIRLNLVAGTRTEVRDYFIKIREEFPNGQNGINVIYGHDFNSYYNNFNVCLETTDILWTKPSELSFYCALGMPIILSEAIGPQEKANLEWLIEIGAGVIQEDPERCDQWLMNLIDNGKLAESAWNGFMKAPNNGTISIIEYLSTQKTTVH